MTPTVCLEQVALWTWMEKTDAGAGKLGSRGERGLCPC